MPTYTVEATKRIYLRTTIEADSLGEAHKIADEELIVPDFEETGTDFTLTHLSAGREQHLWPTP
jgi:hypothetical protein